jgi:hypothetical protein
MTRYKWSRAFKELDKIKAKEKKRLSKLEKPKKHGSKRQANKA